MFDERSLESIDKLIKQGHVFHRIILRNPETMEEKTLVIEKQARDAEDNGGPVIPLAPGEIDFVKFGGI